MQESLIQKVQMNEFSFLCEIIFGVCVKIHNQDMLIMYDINPTRYIYVLCLLKISNNETTSFITLIYFGFWSARFIGNISFVKQSAPWHEWYAIFIFRNICFCICAAFGIHIDFNIKFGNEKFFTDR